MSGQRNFDVLVVGGGAAGLMAAGTLLQRGRTVALFDKNQQLGRKLRITGKGRCNVTNDCAVEEAVAATETSPGGCPVHTSATTTDPDDPNAGLDPSDPNWQPPDPNDPGTSTDPGTSGEDPSGSGEEPTEPDPTDPTGGFGDAGEDWWSGFFSYVH